MRKRIVRISTCFVAFLCALIFSSLVNTKEVSAETSRSVRMAGDGVWYCFDGNNIDYGYTGLAPNEYGWWKITNGVVDFNYTGLAPNDVGWWKITNGQVDFNFTGLASNEYGWWKITNGQVDFNFTGLAPNEYGWWKITNGQVDFNFTGLAPNDVGWWKITNGQVDFNFTGLAPNDVGWWKITNGQVDFNFTGLAPNDVGWWKITNGQVDFGFTGLAENEVGWWKVTNGQIDFNFNGLAPNQYGWWYLSGGSVNFNYTGMAQNDAGWWYVRDGGVDFGYTGLGHNDYGWWYYRNGQIPFDFSGTVKINGESYTIKGGQVIKRGNDEMNSSYTVGQATRGTVESGVYIIRSNSNANYALTAVEDKTAQGGYNLVMSQLDGGNDQKFLVVRDNSGNYCFMSMKYLDSNGSNPDGKWLINSINGGWGHDNVQVTSNSVGGAKTWRFTEVSSGNYMISVLRGDNYQFYLTADGGVSEKANVIAAENSDASRQTFNFVSPYTKTLADGIYSIDLSQNTGRSVSVESSSVKDNAAIVVGNKSAGTDQMYQITCTDAAKGLYLIKNVNSQRYLYTKGATAIGAPIMQISKTGQIDQLWYIQKNTDNTYSIISAASNQVLTYTNAANGTKLVQSIGNDDSTQKFVMNARTLADETLSTGVYSFGSNQYRVTCLGMGVYTVYSLSNNGYVTSLSSGLSYQSDDAGYGSKWRITKSGSQYVCQSVATGKYLTDAKSLSDSSVKLTVTNLGSSITNYASRYDLTALAALDSSTYGNTQVIKRMKSLGIKRSDLMDPINSQKTLESNITTTVNAALPSSQVNFTGNTVKSLNDFMRTNAGKEIVLTQDIQVYVDETQGEYGLIAVPTNTVLNGNGHKLVLRSGSKVPETGINFFYHTTAGQKIYSNNCGVKNLTTEIAYSIATVNAFGADNILIENNNFSNAGMHAVVIADKDTNETVGGMIVNNTFTNTKDDAIGVYGNNSKLLIANNTITNSSKYGIMLSCLREGQQEKVENELTGPHDIIVRNNKVSRSEWCAVYCLGTYRAYITGNELTYSKLEGICMDSGCIGTYFAYNTVTNNGLKGGLPGVSIDNSIYNIVDKNTVKDNATNGIKLVRTGLGNVIVNNICTNNSVNNPSGGTTAGISIEARPVDAENHGYLDGFGSDCNVVYNNQISGSQVHGIMISEDGTSGKNAGNVVKNNRVSSAYAYGTVNFSTLNNIVKDNIIQ